MATFMASSLSNLVDSLIEWIHKVKCKDCDCFLEYESLKGNSIKYKCLSCNENYSSKLDEELKKKFKNTFINKFILLLKKGVYLFDYMDDWEKFNEIKLPRKEEVYSNVDMEEITDADYKYGKRVCKNLK